MSLVTKMRSFTGSVPEELLEQGLLGRGIITSVEQTAVSRGPDFDPVHVCVFTVEVALGNTPRYTASCQQAVSATDLLQVMLGGATIALRVDPDDHSRIALSLSEESPTIGDPNAGSATRTRDPGAPSKTAIVEAHPTGTRSSTRTVTYAFPIDAIAEGPRPYQTRAGQSVPEENVPLVYPGNVVPAKRMALGPDHEIVIDWDTALPQVELATA